MSMGVDHPSYLEFISGATSQMLVNGLKIAAPAAAILLIVDFSFAMLARAVPQMNVFFVGMPLKALCGLMLMVVVLPLVSTFIGQMVAGMPLDLSNAMQGMRQP